MKYFIKFTGLFLFSLLFLSNAASAQDSSWRLGFGAGYMNYYGDLTPKLGDEIKNHYRFNQDGRNFSYGIFLEKRMSGGSSFVINGNWGSITANDLNAEDPTYRDRALNFYTKIKDLSGTYVFRTDNGRLLKETAFLAPYFFVGVGVTQFDVYGDLKDDSKEPFYDYTTAPYPVQDGIFETNLSDLNVEKDYKQTIMNIPFGVGLRLRVSQNWHLHFQTDVKYMFTDYLDDVSTVTREDFGGNATVEQAYNPNPNYIADNRAKRTGLENDLYAFTSLGLRFNIGNLGGNINRSSKKGSKKRGSGFTPPVFPPSTTDNDMNTEAVYTMENDNDQGNQTIDTENKKADDIVEEVEIVEEDTDAKADKKKNRKDKEVEIEETEVEVEEVEVEEIEVELEEVAAPETPVSPQVSTPATPAPVVNYPMNNGGSGSGYDPTVEMLKLEVDRLRAENSEVKNQQQINDLKNQIQQLQNQMDNGNGGNGNDNYNNGRKRNYRGNDYYEGDNDESYNGRRNDDRKRANRNGEMGEEEYEDEYYEEGGKMEKRNGKSDNNLDNDDSSYYQENGTNANSEITVQEEKKGFFKRIFGRKSAEEKAAKKAKKAAKKEAKRAKKAAKEEAEANGEEVEKEGFFNRVMGKIKNEPSNDPNTVSVDVYEFNFVGNEVAVNNQLKNQLKKIGKQVNKSDNSQLIFKAETTKANSEKTNTIAVKLAQILNSDYNVSPSKITYKIDEVEKSASSTSENQLITIEVIR